MAKHSMLFILSSLCFMLSCKHHHHYYHNPHHHTKHHGSYFKKNYHSQSMREFKVTIQPLGTSSVKGWVRFKRQNKKVLVTAEITGLEAHKKYGFHIHQYGDCQDNGSHAGGHLNPGRGTHKAPGAENGHMGDMGNLVADQKGVAVYQQSLSLCPWKLAGRSIIIHAKEDDLKTQPSGNAGNFIACGVVGHTKSLSLAPPDTTSKTQQEDEELEDEDF